MAEVALESGGSALRYPGMTHQPPNAYVLGSDRRELERLDRQAAAIEAATRLLLRQSGVSPGMRVLDLGSGPGHVTHLVA